MGYYISSYKDKVFEIPSDFESGSIELFSIYDSEWKLTEGIFSKKEVNAFIENGELIPISEPEIKDLLFNSLFLLC